jgi:spermidine/putrescine transport system substrate-binding protein
MKNKSQVKIIRLTRRQFLKGTGLSLVGLGMGPLLSSCGPAATPTPEEIKIGGGIQFMSWEGYDLRGCMEAWEGEHNATMESAYIGDHAEIQAKLAAVEPGLYDLITFYHAYSDLYAKELKIIQPLDEDKLPNLEDLIDLFKTGRWWVSEDGTRWGVPFTWGAEGVNYNADEIDPVESWFDLLKPEFKGRIALVDDLMATALIGAHLAGLAGEYPYLTQEQLAQVFEALQPLKEQSRAIAPSYGDLTEMLVSGEVVAGIPGWAAVGAWAQDRDVNVKTSFTKEGHFTFIDAFAIPVGSDNVETVMAWINHAISPEIQACQAKALAAGVVNPKAIPLLDETIATLFPYDAIDEFFQKNPVYDLPPLKSDQYATYDDWLAGWEAFKAG